MNPRALIHPISFDCSMTFALVDEISAKNHRNMLKEIITMKITSKMATIWSRDAENSSKSYTYP